MSLNQFLSNAISGPAWSDKDETDILKPFAYCVSVHEETLFLKVLFAFNFWLKIDPATLQGIGKLNETINTALLMLDDIEDDSELRGGKPVTHKVYGVPRTISIGSYALTQAYDQLARLPTDTPQGLAKRNAILTQEMLTFHRGQSIEIFWRDTDTCPSVEQFISMCKNKTSSFFRLWIRLAATYSDESIETYLPFLDILGVYYQILDDLMSLDTNEGTDSSITQGKAFAEDITEGKFSFLIAHAMTAGIGPKNTWLLDVLKQRTTDPALKLAVIDYLKNTTKSFEYTSSVLDVLEAQLRQEIVRLGGNPELEQILDVLHVTASTSA